MSPSNFPTKDHANVNLTTNIFRYNFQKRIRISTIEVQKYSKYISDFKSSERRYKLNYKLSSVLKNKRFKNECVDIF